MSFFGIKILNLFEFNLVEKIVVDGVVVFMLFVKGDKMLVF